MTDGLVQAWDLPSRRPVQMRWRDGLITALDSAGSAPTGLWLAPPLLDVQINGFAGVDFQQDDLAEEDLLTAARALRAAGCTQFYPTLVTDHWPILMSRLANLRRLRAQSPELAEAIAGWHLEGPFLSSVPGFCGAHRPECMSDPTLERIKELRAVTGADPLLLTLAPERPGSAEAIRLAVSLGLVVSLGHTNASQEDLRQAVEAGATGFTHFGNACPQELDRHDNILWRVLDTPGLTLSLIPDGWHVSPALFRLIHRLQPDGGVYYTSDAMAAAAASPGRYRLGHLELEVGPDQVVRQPGRRNFAGSALRPIEGVFRAARMTGWDWQRCWEAFSLAPARFVRRPSLLETGRAANFCLIEVGASGELERLRVFVRGRESPW